MTFDPISGAVEANGQRFHAWQPLAELRNANAAHLDIPVVSNGEWLTYRIEAEEAVFHLMFQEGRLWQMSLALKIPSDSNGVFSAAGERQRHAAHQALLRASLGIEERFTAYNGAVIAACRDPKNLGGTIEISYRNVYKFDSQQPNVS